MRLSKYYRNAVIYPAIFILFFSIIYSILHNYKSNGLTDIPAFLMPVIPALIYSLLMCILSLTIFLNKLKKIKNNLIYNLLTWFLLPFVYLSIVLVHDINNRMKFEFGFGIGFLYLLMMTIPFVVGLCLTFMKYRLKLATANTA